MNNIDVRNYDHVNVLCVYSAVSSQAALPSRGKERLVAIDTKLGPMTLLSFHISGCGLGTRVKSREAVP